MSYTYHQAKNPTTINITDEHVTESELPERLSELNIKTTALTYHPEREMGPGMTTPACTEFSSSVHVYGEVTSEGLNNLYSNTMGITYDLVSRRTLISNIGKATITSFNDDKSVECYGALTATNVSSTNKADIEALQTKTQNINVDGTALRIKSITAYDSNNSFMINRVSPYMETVHNVITVDNNSGITTFNQPIVVTGNITATNVTALETKTKNINEDGTVLSNIATLNGRKIGAPVEFMYNDEASFIPVVGTDGVMEVGRYIDFHAADTTHDFWTRLMCVGQNVLEIAGVSSMRMSRIDVSLGMALRPGNTLMRFQKSDTSTNMLTLDADTNVATFLGNVVSPNITALETKTQFLNSDGTVLTAPSFTYDTGATGNTSSRTFKLQRGTGHMTFGNATSHGENFFPMFTSKPVGDASFQLRAHQGTAESVNPPFLFQLAAPTSGAISGVKKGFQFLNWATEIAVLNTDGSLSCAGNITTPSLNGNKIGSPAIFRYDAVTPFIPVVGSDGIMEVGARIDFQRVTTEEDYTVGLQVATLNRLSIRHNNTAYAGDLELGTTFFRNTGGTCSLYSNHHSNLQWANNSGVNTWIMDATTAGERWSTTRINATNASTRTTAMSYTAPVEEPPSPSNTTIAGDLTVTGSIHGTLSGSQTITHKTKYIRTITPGCFVESTGQIYREPLKVGTTSTWNEPTEEGQQGYYTTTQVQSSLSPYENCISTVRQAEGFSSNIIGVCTEVINHEFCKFATHGDCLIKCESATYTCGDIIVPSINGYGKKGSSTDVLNCMLSMTPRLKVTSVDTDEIDPQCVVGFITV